MRRLNWDEGVLSSLFVKSLIGTVILVAVFSGSWAYQREDHCRRLRSSLNPQGDVQVRRTSAGVCYPCRSDGPLFDVMYRVCAAEDRVYFAP